MAVIGQMTLHKPTPLTLVDRFPEKPGEFQFYQVGNKPRAGILLSCPFCGVVSGIGAPTWAIVKTEPISILPSILQPGACHYHITDGIAVPCQDSKSPTTHSIVPPV